MKLSITIVLIISILVGVALDTYNVADQTLGEPLYRLAFAVLIPFLVTLPFPRRIFVSWIQFVRWSLPIAILLVFLTPITSGAWTPLYSITREETTLLVSALFVLGSFGTIIKALRVKPPTPMPR